MTKPVQEQWSWKVGILLGIGEAAWQECNGRIQKLTAVVVGPGGRIGLIKCVSPMCMARVSPDFDAAKLVLIGEDPSPDFCEDLDRFWSGGRIMLGNNVDIPGPRLLQ